MKINIAKAYRLASERRLACAPDMQAIKRAQAAYRKNRAEPGDCKDNLALLAGLAIAQAEIGLRPGWIPEVQALGAKIAVLFKQT